MRHRRSHARAVQAGAATRNCKFCGQEFVNNKILMRHIITNHESQQMDYLATSLHSQKKEDDPMECHERPTTEDLPLYARKAASAPKLLLPGFFHPTLKKGPFVEETHAKKRSAFEQKNCVIKNLAKLKETNYFVIDKSVDGGNVVKIITSEGKKHNSIPNDIEREDNEEGVGGSLDITESLDRMLDLFEKEEREERESWQMEKETTQGGEAKEEKAVDKNGESGVEQDAVSDKEEKTCDKKSPAKERSPSEGEFLNISFHDEILTEEQGSSGQKRRMAIVKDSRVVGRVTTSSQFRPPESRSYPYFHTSASQSSLSDQYEQFWTQIGLVPKIKQRTVDRKVAKRKSEQKKGNLMVSSGGAKIKKPWSPTKSICMKKFPSEGFSSPDTSNYPSSVRALATRTEHNTSLKCDICSEGFLDNEFLVQHVKEKHPKLSKSNKSVSKNEVPPNKSCDVRKFKEGKWQVNTERGVTAMKTVDSKICKEEKTESLTHQQIQLQKKVKDGLGNPAGKLKCVSCEFRTNFNWYLKKHTLSKHKDVKDYEFFCLKCDFKTNFKWNLKKHWNNKHSGCNSDLKKGKDDEDRIQKDLAEVKKSKSMEEAESIETKASRSKNGYSPKQDKDDRINEKSATKKRKDVKRVKGKSASGFIDKKLSEVPELNPYSRQLSCSRKEGRGGGERDLDEERKRNLVESVTEPYCRLCQLLLEPELRFGLMRKGEGVATKLPKHSVVWVPNRKEGNGVNEENEDEEDEEESVISRLLVCSSCQLCVHRSCYLLPEEGNNAGWTCQACSLPPSATCSLCQQPGGLLQRTDRGRLIHLDCAILLPETTITGEGRLSLKQVPEKRRCLECVVCGGQESQPGVHCQVRSRDNLQLLRSQFAGEQSVSGGVSPRVRAPLRSRCGRWSAGSPHPSLWILCRETWSQGAPGGLWGHQIQFF